MNTDAKAKEKGLLIRQSENGFSLYSALNTDLQTVDKGVDILNKCI